MDKETTRWVRDHAVIYLYRFPKNQEKGMRDKLHVQVAWDNTLHFPDTPWWGTVQEFEKL